jgi:hypothetical protein
MAVGTQASERPRFRQDLVAEPIDDDGKKFIDVMDPDSGNVFRFYEVEYSLACGMDGDRDVAGIVRWAHDELGMQPSPNEVRAVISTLVDLGYLDTGERAREATKPEPELEPGIVVPPRAVEPPTHDVELGRAGSAVAAKEPEPVRAPAFELGAPGSSQAKRPTPPIPTEDIALGAPGRDAVKPAVSTDLAADLPIRPDDVKEAVRASQVMRAVDVPKDLLDAIDEPKPVAVAKADARPAEVRRPEPPAAQVEAKKPEPKKQPEPKQPEVKQPEARRPEVKQPEAKRPEVATAKPAAALETKPRPPVEARTAPPAPTTSTNPILIVLLVVVVLAAVAFVAWKYVFAKSDDTVQSEKAAPAMAPPAPKAPEPPPVEVEKLASETPAPVEVKAPTAGQIDTIAADAQVTAGDVVVALVGHKPIETEVTGIAHDIDKRLKPDLEQAQKDRATLEAAGNKPALAAADKKIQDKQKALDEKQAKLDARKLELARYVVRAPAPGKVSASVKPNAKVGANDVVAKLVRAPVLAATFESTSQPVLDDARVLLAVKGSDKKLSCVVMSTGAGGTKIGCPGDAASEGTEVTFVGLDTSTPAAEIDMGGETSGSGSGSGATSGVTSPAPVAHPPASHPMVPPPATTPTPAEHPAGAAAPASAPTPAAPTPAASASGSAAPSEAPGSASGAPSP